MIRNIMFDMVGVIMRFDTEGYLLKNHISDSDRAILEREVFHSLEWARGDRGTIQEEEAVSAICSRTPSRLHVAVRDLIYRENRDILPVEGMTDLLSTIKSAGYNIYLLSNTSVRQHAFWKDPCYSPAVHPRARNPRSAFWRQALRHCSTPSP